MLIYAISDIHGYYSKLQNALKKIDLSVQDSRLIILGDMIDVGSDSKRVLELIMALEKKYSNQIITLLGNHEEWFISWINGEIQSGNYTSYSTGIGANTINSFISTNEKSRVINSILNDLSIPDEAYLHRIDLKIKEIIVERYSELINWLLQKVDDPRYFETPKQIFVHAGIDEDLGENWKKYSDPFIFTNKFPASLGNFYKDIISGHIHSNIVANDDSYLGKVFYDGYSHYYIDGNVSKSKEIPVLVYDTSTNIYYTI
ncbi:diadenosine tetraphosphatase [Streptococcus parauberis]|uniref:metallophosphoesterase n=1 Tax=Streptococcus parauberis TaxID=1348 RepID=UPI000CCECCF6|nr:metallophosphoesterase [Streptococcus parauberis]PNY21817.1 diadenosine tetraphosphatase [Streptococcus parauberis]